VFGVWCVVTKVTNAIRALRFSHGEIAESRASEPNSINSVGASQGVRCAVVMRSPGGAQAKLSPAPAVTAQERQHVWQRA
jgi:hypothetical protein